MIFRGVKKPNQKQRTLEAAPEDEDAGTKREKYRKHKRKSPSPSKARGEQVRSFLILFRFSVHFCLHRC